MADMNLSPELIAHIGCALREQVFSAIGSRASEHARAMQLEWVRAIEAALREDEQREIDANAKP